ncbi:MAG TPA: cytidylate kinase-like family protein [Dehalococcoidia bacterium]|nr:cytidylate kinase-like family protein [Dehalococcoidia bacterium]
MPYTVVTVARSLGARGEEVAHAAAGGLGYRYVDDEIVLRAAEKAGVSPEAVERAEQRRPLMLRMLEAMATAPSPELAEWNPALLAPQASSEAYQAFITEVIRETAQAGRVLIMAHGGGIHLAGMPGVLRVFVTASPAVRAQRLAAEAKLEQRAAEKAVADSDKSRADFLRRFYGLREEGPSHYDIVLNTDVLTSAEAAAIIVAAAGAA